VIFSVAYLLARCLLGCLKSKCDEIHRPLNGALHGRAGQYEF